MRVYTCTGDWPVNGYDTPLFRKTYVGTAPDATADEGNSGHAGYQNLTAKSTTMEVVLIPLMRNIYAYEISANSIYSPVNGDYYEIGEYDAAGAAIWVRRFNYTGGAWDYSYSRVICEGLTVTLYNSYGDKITLPRTKPYGRLFMRVSSSGATEAYLRCYAIYTEVTKEMILDSGSWGIAPHNPAYPAETVDAYLRTETTYEGYPSYYIRYNRVESASIEISKPKTAITASGKPISVSGYTFQTPIKAVFDCVLTDIEIAVWRKHMELPQWGKGSIVYISTMPNFIPNNDYAIESVDFGDEIEYGTGLYKARITMQIMAYTNEAIPSQITTVNQGYPTRSAVYRHSQVVSATNIRNTMQEPIDACTVKMFHIPVSTFGYIRSDIEHMLYSYIEYAPPAGTSPFGPHRGDGPFLAKIAGFRATVSNVNRVDAELDLIYYGEA